MMSQHCERCRFSIVLSVSSKAVHDAKSGSLDLSHRKLLVGAIWSGSGGIK